MWIMRSQAALAEPLRRLSIGRAMKKLLIAFAILTGCSGGDEQQAGGNASAPAQGSSPARPRAPGAALTTLTGLYEGGDVDPRNQMCIIDGDGEDDARFGLVVWGANMHSCSGVGSVSREGGTLKLTMTGDSACTIEARIEGDTIILPASVPEGCAYYCGARAKLGSARLTQNGATRDDALKAKDLVGEPLCGTG